MITKSRLVASVMMMSTLGLLLSCATLAISSPLHLTQRILRVSEDGAYTEYRWYREYRCGFLGLKKCQEEHIEKDFDFMKPEDRKKFNDMGFECSIRNIR